MHRFFLLCLTLTFFCTDAAATSREIRKRAATIEKQLDLMQDAHKLLRITARAPRDSRGRNKIEDLEQWAYTAELDGRVAALLKSARAADDVQANVDLDEASRVVNGASKRAMEIAGYWQRTSTILWRERWKSFATLNELPAEPSDPSLLEAERSMHALLNAGDFARATGAAAIVDEKLQTAIRKATSDLARARPDVDLKYVPRTTPCQSPDLARKNAAITQAAPPDDYYPAGAKRREEQGEIVVRTHVTAAGCASEFAVVVSSGYPDLDQGAIQLAEASRYAAGKDGENPADGYVTFKVRFEIAP
jgi:TonB family protein